ncbi:MAG TPA: glutathione synthase, partial [Nitrosospira sp.]|nr:glutathione synthase [Nitrosospira sp.]
MELAFILDHLDSIKTYKDSSFAMMREAVFRGHKLFAIQQGELVWSRGEVFGLARALELTGE